MVKIVVDARWIGRYVGRGIGLRNERVLRGEIVSMRKKESSCRSSEISVAEMVGDQLRGEIFQVRRRRKGLGIAGPRVYHWLLRSYFSRESMTIEKMIG